MDYKEALKKVQTRKAKENYFVFNFAYDTKVVLPHKDGITLLASLANAEVLLDPYSGQHAIREMPRDKVTVTQMSQEEYERYKIAALLNITIAEVETFSLQVS